MLLLLLLWLRCLEDVWNVVEARRMSWHVWVETRGRSLRTRRLQKVCWIRRDLLWDLHVWEIGVSAHAAAGWWDVLLGWLGEVTTVMLLLLLLLL